LFAGDDGRVIAVLYLYISRQARSVKIMRGVFRPCSIGVTSTLWRPRKFPPARKVAGLWYEPNPVRVNGAAHGHLNGAILCTSGPEHNG